MLSRLPSVAFKGASSRVGVQRLFSRSFIVPANKANAISRLAFVNGRESGQSFRNSFGSSASLTPSSALKYGLALGASAVLAGIANELSEQSRNDQGKDLQVLEEERQQQQPLAMGPAAPANLLDNFLHSFTAPVIGIIAVNAAIHAAWYVVPKPIMTAHFTSNAANLLVNKFGAVHTLVTSVFSHQSLLHFAFNMYALSSVGPSLVHTLGANEFMTLYLASGLVASVAGTGGSILRYKMTGNAAQLAVGSLGASGAVFGCFTTFANCFPDLHFKIIFLPFLQSDAVSMIQYLAAFDAAGYVYSFFRHSPLDHAAHLGGVATGYAFYKANEARIEQRKQVMMRDYQRRLSNAAGRQ